MTESSSMMAKYSGIEQSQLREGQRSDQAETKFSIVPAQSKASLLSLGSDCEDASSLIAARFAQVFEAS